MTKAGPVVLTIAGSDSGGGAGIQADLKTFAAFGCFGTSAITAVTAQNTVGVQGVEMLAPSFVTQQIESVLSDFPVRAIKIGMLGSAAVIHAVADVLGSHGAEIPIVLDPVMVATSGDPLLKEDAVGALKSRLFPLARLVTPNAPEAARLLECTEARAVDELEEQAQSLVRLDCRAVLVKGGHLPAEAELIDVLAEASRVQQFATERVGSKPIHGTGCTLSSAIASGLALGGNLEDAIRGGQVFVRKGIRQSLNYIDKVGPNGLGRGATAIHHAAISMPPES